jgi:AcrR family transcriptional regulator
MARPAYSEDQILEIQEEIRSVALTVFRRDGIRALTLRNIAREMSRTPAALYRYYASKDDLLTAICADGFREMGAALRAAREGAGDTRVGARAAMRAYLDFAIREPERFSLMYSLDRRDLPVSSAVREARELAFGETRTIAEEAIEAGWLEGDPNVAAHLLWVSCHGLAALAMSDQLDLGCSYEDLREPLLDRIIPCRRGSPGVTRR